MWRAEKYTGAVSPAPVLQGACRGVILAASYHTTYASAHAASARVPQSLLHMISGVSYQRLEGCLSGRDQIPHHASPFQRWFKAVLHVCSVRSHYSLSRVSVLYMTTD